MLYKIMVSPRKKHEKCNESRVKPHVCKVASSLSFSSDLVRGVHARERVEKRGRQPEKKKRLPHLAPSVTRVVICVSWAFCSTDQEKRETARSLHVMSVYSKGDPPTAGSPLTM